MTARRKNRVAMALLGALGAGLVLLAMPVGLIETIVASSGLSEALPAAAPPLGIKARLLLAGFGAVMMLGLIWAGHEEQGAASLARKKKRGRKNAPGVRKMGFALSKLNWLARGRGESSGARGPALRRADAHPDAPARAPIFASRDFGGLDIFARTAPGRGDAAPEPEQGASPADLAMPATPQDTSFVPLNGAALPDEAVYAEFEEIAEPATQAPATARPESLSIAELTERLEHGLAQRKRIARPVSVIADMPVAPPVPVRQQVEEDADQALRAALGTLRSMTGRAR